MRIPFSSLQFQEKDGKVEMGITTWRWIARKNETDIFPAIPPDWGEWSMWKPSQSQRIQQEQVKRKKPLYIAPYLLAGYNEAHELNEQNQGYTNQHKTIKEAGLDLKYGLTKNLTLDLTANTDFAQVEADDQIVNLTRFSVFFPEKRVFFQERSGIFDFDFGRAEKLFYTRRIGLRADQQVRIYGGARLVGRVGQWDLGFMDMQTGPTDTIASENFGVLRVRRNVLNDRSNVGAIITNQMDFNGNYNTTYGFDTELLLGKKEFLTFRVAQTLQNNKPNDLLSMDPTRVWISMSRQEYKGFTYGISYSRAGQDFNPSMGFQSRENFTRTGARLSYGIISQADSKLQRHSVLYRHQMFFGNATKALETYDGGLSWDFLTKSGYFGEFGFSYNYEYLLEDLEFTDNIAIPKGFYRFPNLVGTFSTPDSRAAALMTEASSGPFYDGYRHSIELTPTFNVSSSLEITGVYQFNHLNFKTRQAKEDIHIARIKVLYMLDTKFSISSVIQLNSSSHTLLGNVRLRYNPKEGNDFYIVYNDDWNTNRDFHDFDAPRLPFSNARSILVKYTYTLNL